MVSHEDGAQAERRLIEHEDGRLAHHGPADGEHLLFAAREGAGFLTRSRLQHGEEVVGPFQGLVEAKTRALEG